MRRALRASTVFKLMLALLGCALFAGWKMQHLRIAWSQCRRADPAVPSSPYTQTGAVWGGGSGAGDGSVVESCGSAARRRHTPKRPRLQAV